MLLEEMFASEPKFMLASKQKEYTLRIPNLSDRVKFKEILGGDESSISKIFNELQWDVIAKLVYRLLIEKEDFIAFTEKGFNDDGQEVTYLITGPALLMRAVKNLDEATGMMAALVNALRLGDPLIDKAVQEMLAEKKSQVSQTGQTSLTPSRQNMDTPQESLAN